MSQPVWSRSGGSTHATQTSNRWEAGGCTNTFLSDYRSAANLRPTVMKCRRQKTDLARFFFYCYCSSLTVEQFWLLACENKCSLQARGPWRTAKQRRSLTRLRQANMDATAGETFSLWNRKDFSANVITPDNIILGPKKPCLNITVTQPTVYLLTYYDL